MATVYDTDSAGMAEFTTEQYTQNELFAGDYPDRWTQSDRLVSASAIASVDLLKYSVVGLNSAGELVLADPSLGTPVLPIGITTARVKVGATNRTVAIWRAGCFNTDAMQWSAYYSTDLLKRRAFEGGYSQAAFNLIKPNYSGVIF